MAKLKTIKIQSKNLRKIREKKGLTRLDVALRARGIYKTTMTSEGLRRWEEEGYPIPKSILALFAIAEGLEVDIMDIIKVVPA